MYKFLKLILLNLFKNAWNKAQLFIQLIQPTIIEILNFTTSFYSNISIVNRMIAAFLGLGSLLLYGRLKSSYSLMIIALILLILVSYHVLNLFSLPSSLLYLYLSTLVVIILTKSLILSFGFYICIKIFVIIKIIKFKGFK